MTETTTKVALPAITQPSFPGITSVVEYELCIEHTPSGDEGFAQTRMLLPGLDTDVDEALRTFRSVTSWQPPSGVGQVLLIAWSGADHDLAVGMILARHEWNRYR